MKLLTLNEYAEALNCNLKGATLSEIQEYVQDEFDLTVWDYPLQELEYVLTEVNESVCFVKVDNEIRICEI
jgi:hypothetical protein